MSFPTKKNSRLRWTPEAYQKRAVRFLLERSYAGLFLEPGMRKTSIMLATLRVLINRGLARRALVVTQLSVATDAWPPEIDKWEDFRDLTYRVAHGKDREPALRDENAKIVILNFEGLRSLIDRVPTKGKKGRFKYLPNKDFRGSKWPFDTLIIDESTRLKHSQTDRFKRLKAVLPLFNRRYLLTGTPTPKGYLDLFGQIYLLDLGRSLGRYITHYRNRWFTPSGYGGHTWTIDGDRAKREIERAIAPMILRLASSRHQQLPPLYGAMGFPGVEPRIDWVDLPAPAMRDYRKLERELFLILDAETVSAKNAGVAAMKCRQIANGCVFTDPHQQEPVKARRPKRIIVRVHDAKINRLLKILGEPGFKGNPVMIAYEFRHDLARLRVALGKDLPAMGGGMKRADFTATREAWNRGELPLLAVQPQTVAMGLNLQSAGYGIIFFSLSWDTEAYLQLVRRLWRSGRREAVYVRHIAARCTVDEAVLIGLQGDTAIQNGLLDALDAYRHNKK